jgi:hypothetical protein
MLVSQDSGRPMWEGCWKEYNRVLGAGFMEILRFVKTQTVLLTICVPF